MASRSELRRAYKEARPAMGVFVIRNLQSGRFDVRSAANLQAAMNRLLVEVTPSTNPNLALQRDWRELGREAFEVKVLDLLEPKETAGWSPAEDLAELEAMWRARLIDEGGTLY